MVAMEDEQKSDESLLRALLGGTGQRLKLAD